MLKLPPVSVPMDNGVHLVIVLVGLRVRQVNGMFQHGGGIEKGAAVLFGTSGDACQVRNGSFGFCCSATILLLVVVADVLLLVIALALYTIEPPVSRRGDESSEQAHQE